MRPPLALLVCALSLPAGAAVEALGFSPDGKQVVMLEHGVAEGSGFPWAKVTVLETARGTVVGRPFEVERQDADATEADAVKQAKEAFEAAREKMKIAPLRPGREIAHDAKGVLHDRQATPIGTVKIEARKAAGKEASRACEPPFSPLLLTVTLHWVDDDSPARLLADKKVPKERACLTGCELGRVFADGRTALVLLQCSAPGFEGPETRNVPIAARLAYGLDEDLPGSDARPSE